MKIFILNPFLYTGKLSKRNRKRQPLSLAYIASLLRDQHQIKLLDANALNLNLDETTKEIKDFNPEILILTSTPIDRWQAPSHAHVKILARNILQTLKKINVPYTILTGTHGTITPEWIFEKTKVDFVVRGEPEYTTLKLVKALINRDDISKINGISFLKKKKLINNPNAERIKDLDNFPMPAYDLLPMEKYSYTFNDIPTPFSIIESSRGCPYKCIYCVKAMMQGNYIVRSPESVVNEMKYLVNKFSIQGIYFQDWEFTINTQRVMEICGLILENNLNVKWGCNARVPDLREDVVKKMKQAGCVRINIGFESGSQKVLEIIKKSITQEQIHNATMLCKKYNINIGVYSILNLPGETKETIRETEEFLIKNDLEVMCSENFPIPYFGTPMYEMLKQQEGRDFDWEELDKFAGKINVAQPPWLAKIYRWHYKLQGLYGNFYFFKKIFWEKILKRIKI